MDQKEARDTPAPRQLRALRSTPSELPGLTTHHND